MNERVIVVAPPDEYYPKAIVYGWGMIVRKSVRTEVRFDSGGGGVFPHELIHPEPQTWAAVATHLRRVGWTVDYKPLDGFPPYLWMSQDGVSGSDYRSGSPDAPPEAVMRDSYAAKYIGFTHLAATG